MEEDLILYALYKDKSLLPKYLGNGLFELMTNARNIADANHSFSIKGSSDELFQAAKVAFKVRDKNILKEIRIEMDDRKKNRKKKGKPDNNLLNRYLIAVIDLEKKIT